MYEINLMNCPWNVYLLGDYFHAHIFILITQRVCHYFDVCVRNYFCVNKIKTTNYGIFTLKTSNYISIILHEFVHNSNKNKQWFIIKWKI